MKQLKIENGEVRNAYELDDLSKDARNKAISEHISFIIHTMHEDSPYYDAVEEAERYKTPWFLHEILWEEHEERIIEEIKANSYLFDEYGEILPITYHMKDNEVNKITWKGEYNVEIL